MWFNVLIVGATSAAAITLMKTLPSSDVRVYGCDVDALAPGLFRLPESSRLRLENPDSARLADEVLALCVKHGIDVVVPSEPQQLDALAAARDAFAGCGVRLLVPSDRARALYRDAWESYLLFAAVAPVPRTELCDAEFDAQRWRCPCIVRPRDQLDSRPLRRIANWHELAELPRDGSLMLQEYLPGEAYAVDVLVSGGRVAAAVPRQCLRAAGDMSLVSATVEDSLLSTLAGRLVAAFEAGPLASVRFRRDARGIPRVIGLKPHSVGGMSLSAAAGVNIPALALREALGGSVVERRLVFRELAMVRSAHDTFLDPSELHAASSAQRASDIVSNSASGFAPTRRPRHVG